MSDSAAAIHSSSHRIWTTAVVFLSIVLASAANHFLARWLGISRTEGVGIYRRVGPETGPQVFCAGSSLLVSALSWSRVSEGFGRGVETWGVGGSSPEIWEAWQARRPHSNTTIIGVSVYDLNEMHLADDRATIVPLSRTVNDLWLSGASSALSHRILAQYMLTYVRLLFPTAGTGDKVLRGLRSRAANLLGLRARLTEYEGVVYEPRPPLLDAGESTATVSEWSSARVLRRMAALRVENRGHHEFFKGPKHAAFCRLLSQARRQGRVIVVVLPVTKEYTQEFLNAGDVAAFEKAMNEAVAIAPDATLVRLDRVQGISDPRYFLDLVHMNSLGRRVATQAFLMEVTQKGPQQMLEATSTHNPR
jgi:hypothetical protein